MAYTYDDFLRELEQYGLTGRISDADMETAKTNPEFGRSAVSLKNRWLNATTDEERDAANRALNELRSSTGNYSGGSDGMEYVYQGKVPGQIDRVLDRLGSYGSFQYDRAAPTYENPYARQQQQLTDRLLNMGPFSWSKEEDPNWSAYRKEYLREGDRAAANALAQASAASGGRASSAAVTAAGQAGNYYAAQLADRIPELYQAAYQRWLQEYSRAQSDLSAVNQQEQLAYQKYLDQLGQYNADRDLAYNQYLGGYDQLQSTLASLMAQEQSDYAKYQDLLDRIAAGKEQQYRQEQDALDREMQEREWQASQARQALEDRRYEEELAYSRQQAEAQLARQAEADAYNRWLDQQELNLKRQGSGLDPVQYAALTGPEGSASGGTGASGGGNGSAGGSRTPEPEHEMTGRDFADYVRQKIALGEMTEAEAWAFLARMGLLVQQ